MGTAKVLTHDWKKNRQSWIIITNEIENLNKTRSKWIENKSFRYRKRERNGDKQERREPTLIDSSGRANWSMACSCPAGYHSTALPVGRLGPRIFPASVARPQHQRPPVTGPVGSETRRTGVNDVIPIKRGPPWKSGKRPSWAGLAELASSPHPNGSI